MHQLVELLPEKANSACGISRDSIDFDNCFWIEVLEDFFKVISDLCLSYERIVEDGVFINTVFRDELHATVQISSVESIVELDHSRSRGLILSRCTEVSNEAYFTLNQTHSEAGMDYPNTVHDIAMNKTVRK